MGRNATVEGISPYVLATASIQFSNYHALFYNVYYLQCLFLENNIITDDAQRKITAYAFQLKSFEHNNVILFQAFPNKSEKLISGRRS